MAVRGGHLGLRFCGEVWHQEVEYNRRLAKRKSSWVE